MGRYIEMAHASKATTAVGFSNLGRPTIGGTCVCDRKRLQQMFRKGKTSRNESSISDLTLGLRFCWIFTFCFYEHKEL